MIVMKNLLRLSFSLVFLAFALACEKASKPSSSNPTHTTTPYVWNNPNGFIPPSFPADNPLTEEGVSLGRKLFYDVRLSGDNTMSCASCHLQDFGFSDPNRFSTGIDGIEGSFNAPPIMNLAWQEFFFWDGRSLSLEEQALIPVVDPIEMHEDFDIAIAELSADPDYPNLFKKAFGSTQISKERIGKAIAQFERIMVSSNSKYDRFKKGEESFTDLELEGYNIFHSEIGDCFHCHGDVTTGNIFGAFGDIQFSNNGLDSMPQINSGRERVTGLPEDRAKMKIPSLRNIEYTAPYMHDGRFNTLGQVIEFYNFGGHVTPTTDPNMKAAGVGRNWTLRQKQALIAFLETLSDEEFIQDTTFSDPF
jgi:cytochrome c peroxidase